MMVVITAAAAAAAVQGYRERIGLLLFKLTDGP